MDHSSHIRSLFIDDQMHTDLTGHPSRARERSAIEINNDHVGPLAPNPETTCGKGESPSGNWFLHPSMDAKADATS
jgi:hypothetical protein